MDDSRIIRDSTTPGDQGVSMSLANMVNAMTFRTSINTVGKNSENMSSKVYNFSHMQNKRVQYELYKGFICLTQRQLHFERACRKDAKAWQIPQFKFSLGKSKLRPRLMEAMIPEPYST